MTIDIEKELRATFAARAGDVTVVPDPYPATARHIGRARRRRVVTAAALTLSLIAAVPTGLHQIGERFNDSGTATLAGPRARQVMTPPIQRYLQSHATDGYLLKMRPELKPRTFCTVQVFETRLGKGNTLLVGILADCSELARQGNALVMGTAFRGAMLATLRPQADTYLVTGVQEPGGGETYKDSLKKTFTKQGLRRLDRLEGRPSPTNDPEVIARKAYGLPPNAPVQPG